MYLQTSLGSYLSVKTIGGVIRCPNRKLWPCTSVDSDFLAFMLPQQSFQYIVKMAKIAVFWGTFELWGSVENFLGVETTQTKYGKSSPNTREYTEKKIMSIRCLDKKLFTFEFFWSLKKKTSLPRTVSKMFYKSRGTRRTKNQSHTTSQSKVVDANKKV